MPRQGYDGDQEAEPEGFKNQRTMRALSTSATNRFQDNYGEAFVLEAKRH